MIYSQIANKTNLKYFIKIFVAKKKLPWGSTKKIKTNQKGKKMSLNSRLSENFENSVPISSILTEAVYTPGLDSL